MCVWCTCLRFPLRLSTSVLRGAMAGSWSTSDFQVLDYPQIYFRRTSWCTLPPEVFESCASDRYYDILVFSNQVDLKRCAFYIELLIYIPLMMRKVEHRFICLLITYSRLILPDKCVRYWPVFLRYPPSFSCYLNHLLSLHRGLFLHYVPFVKSTRS